MAKASLNINTTQIAGLLERYERMGGKIEDVVVKELEKLGDEFSEDTFKAVQKPQLPRRGKFSHGDTEKSVVRNPRAEKHGMMVTIGVGFDFEKESAGGYLIKGYYQNYHGTPRVMQPVKELHSMYATDKYAKKQRNKMMEDVNREIIKLAEGKK